LPDWLVSLPIIGDSVDGWWREMIASKAKLNETLSRFAQPAQQALIKTGLVLGEGVLQLTLTALIGFFFYRDGVALNDRCKVRDPASGRPTRARVI
jgi:predicted PurR-regulated permease PerM